MPSTPVVTTPAGVSYVPGEVLTMATPTGPRPVAFPNPDGFDVLAAQLDARADGDSVIGDRYEAAQAAGVKPETISVWVTRHKIEPVVRGTDKAGDLFHLPTVRAAATRRPGRPRAA
jgi:hypothetical protein